MRFLNTIKDIGITEIILLQIIFYILIWIWNEYVASYLCIVLPVIIAAILMISLIIEMIEPSRISKKYFIVMAASVVIPILVGAGFYFFYDGNLAWLQEL